jgi:hypothetical protein
VIRIAILTLALFLPAAPPAVADPSDATSDSISFGTAAGDVDPVAGQTILAGKTPPMIATVNFTVGSTDNAEVYLELQTGNALHLAFSSPRRRRPAAQTGST